MSDNIRKYLAIINNKSKNVPDIFACLLARLFHSGMVFHNIQNSFKLESNDFR